MSSNIEELKKDNQVIMENNRFKFRNGVMMKRMFFSWGVGLRRTHSPHLQIKPIVPPIFGIIDLVNKKRTPIS